MKPSPAISDQYNITLKRNRIAAALLDLTILWIIGMAAGILSGNYYTDSEGIGVHLKGLPGFVTAIAWLILIPIREGITGQTPGKKAMKIKVVRKNFMPANILICLIRHLLDIADQILFTGLIVASIDKRKRRIGDIVAGTIVVDMK